MYNLCNRRERKQDSQESSSQESPPLAAKPVEVDLDISQVRATALLLFFMQLDNSDRDAFVSILTFKSRVR